jgi:hypothetical protein
VYVSGSVLSKAVYWKNNNQVELPDGSHVYAIQVSGNDVHAIGADFSSSTGIYWKNGVTTFLDLDINNPSIPSSIILSDSDVYLGGALLTRINEFEFTESPKVWKNGQSTLLMTGDADVKVVDISIYKGNVYSTLSSDKFGAKSFVYQDTKLISSNTSSRLRGHLVVKY